MPLNQPLIFYPVSVFWSPVGHFSSKVGPTHNKKVSFAAALSIKVSLNTGNRQRVPYLHYNAMQPFNGSGDDSRLKRDSAAAFVIDSTAAI